MDIIHVDSYIPPVGHDFFCLHWTQAGSDKQAEQILAGNGIPADARIYKTKDGSWWYAHERKAEARP